MVTSPCPEHGSQEVTSVVGAFPHLLLHLACGHWVTEVYGENQIIEEPN